MRHPAAPADHPPAIQGLNLALRTGEQVALIGPSGAGKTTLLQALACARPPSHGVLRLDDVNPWAIGHRALQQCRRQIFLAPQTPPLPPRQRVVVSMMAAKLPTMGWWRSLQHLIRPGDLPAIHHALSQFDLQDNLFDRVDRLSGGERQRVGLAKAWLSPARLWLIDEPLAALDPTRASQALRSLQDRAREQGLTLLVSLHQVEAALKHFPRVIGMREGCCVFDLPADRVSEAVLQQLYGQDPTPAPPVMCR